jgi:hypothetical protein
MTANINRVVVKATIMWAFLTHKKDGNEKHSVELCNLSEPAVDALEDMGIEVKRNKDKPEKGYYITCYSQNPIKAQDKDGLPIDPNIRVGNGSKGVAVITAYEWKRTGKSGTSPSIKKLVIEDLIEFTSSADYNESEVL